MAKITLQASAIVLAVSLVAFVSFTAGATAGATGESAAGDSGESGKSFLQHLHSIGSQIHGNAWSHGHRGGGGFRHHMDELVNQLDLSQEQTERLQAIHRTFESHGGKVDGSMAGLHDQLVEQFEQGHIEADAVRQMIDEQLAEIRSVAYSVTDELLALVNSLDAGQRELVLAHLQGDHAGHSGPGH